MKRIILTTAATLSFCLGASAAIVAQWNFNDNPSDGSATTGTLLPAIGTGIAAPVGGVTSSFNASAGSSDPLGGDANNSAWRLLNFPAQSTGNKTMGGQFNVDTTGYENITFTWDHANSGAANKYYRILYSIDNGVTWVEKDAIVNPVSVTWNNPIATVSFVTVPGANNNTNFGVRILSEFQSTATGSGTTGYVPVGTGSYGTSGTFRMDMVTFNGDLATGNVGIITNPSPSNLVIAVGHPASFSVVAGGGSSAIGYQWRTNSTPIPGATNSTYALAAAQFSDAGNYDVVVTNAVNSVTSTVVTLTVRNPLNLAWTGAASAVWNSAAVNWVNTNTLASVAYAGGDNVMFDSQGSSAPTVNLAETVQPSSVTVDANFDYVLRSDVGGRIVGPTGLTKRGNGMLTLDTDNTYTGPTVIQAGVLQVGAVTNRGSMGTGPVTNNGGLVFNRSDAITVTNNISGSGTVTNLGKNVTLTGANVYNGTIAALSATLLLSGSHTINSTDVLITASASTGAGGASRLALSGGIAVGSGSTLYMSGSSASPDLRCTFYSPGGTNTWSGPIIIAGGGANSIETATAGTELHINGPITGPGFGGSLLLRGTAGAGILNGTITLPGNYVNKTDAGTWTINSTGNSWAGTTLAVGTLRLGANNALPTGIPVVIGQAGIATATLDLGGFNQQLASLQDGGSIEVIGNSSVVSDSTLTVVAGNFNGVIQDTLLGGTRKTALTLNGTTFTLTGGNTYSGETTVAAGTLMLSGAGEIPNSSVINIAGGVLDVTARGDATLTVGAAQKLKGNGTFSVLGNLVNNGTIELKVNKTGGVVSNDKVVVSSQITFGGTLKLVLTGEALTAANTIPVASAGAYAVSAFAAMDPTVPAAGLTWDTSTLATDGVLRIAGTVPPTIATTTLSPSGTQLIFSGTGGGAGGSFSVLTSTNVATPLANWITNQTGVFDGGGNFSVTNAIVPGVPEKFFRLKLP